MVENKELSCLGECMYHVSEYNDTNHARIQRWGHGVRAFPEKSQKYSVS